MKTYLLSLSMLVCAAHAEPNKGGVKELDAIYKSVKTVGDLVDQMKPHVPDAWFDLIAKKSTEARAQAFHVDVKKSGRYLIHVAKQTTALNVIDVEAGRYEIDRKPYALDATKQPEAVYIEVAALTKDKGALVPTLSGIVLANAFQQAQNCNVYGHEMNDACFANDPAKLRATIAPLAQVAGRNVGVCSAQARTEECVRQALQQGKLKLADVKDKKQRAYLETLGASKK